MSFTIRLTDTFTFIAHDFKVPIYWDEDPTVQYEIGLANFDSFNMIPNVDEMKNILLWSEQSQYRVKIPIGSFEPNVIVDKMKRKVLELDNEATFGFIFGFNKRILEANTANESDVKCEF